MQVNATEFARNFRQYNLAARKEPIEVTNHGKLDGAYVSAEDLEILKKAKAEMRVSYTLENMPESLYQQILNARMGSEYNHLNSLMDD